MPQEAPAPILTWRLGAWPDLVRSVADKLAFEQELPRSTSAITCQYHSINALFSSIFICITLLPERLTEGWCPSKGRIFSEIRKHRTQNIFTFSLHEVLSFSLALCILPCDRFVVRFLDTISDGQWHTQRGEKNT